MKRIISRRQFVKKAGATTVAASILGCAAESREAAQMSLAPKPSGGANSTATRPNIIHIILDDLGSIDANCYGAADLATPNIDALAAGGVRFTQFYGAGPICSPARAALMTGRYPRRVGVEDNIGSVPGSAGLGRDQVMLPEWLKASGYATGLVGKWHLGYRAGEMPADRGFDSSFGNMGGCIDNYSHFYYWGGPDRHDLWADGREIWRAGEFYGDMIVDRCNAFIEKSKDRPFFLYCAINQPHYPLQGSTKWRQHYAKLPEPRNLYAASVSTLDEMIGRIMRRVREINLTERTIVILHSDHGHSTEDRAFFGGGNAGPYRGAKFSLFEGGIRVVAMISWPNTLPAGLARNQLVTGCDWMPTVAELAGIRLPDRRLDGRSVAAVLQSADAPSPHPEFHWESGKQWAVRQGDWKLVANAIDSSHKAPVGEADKLFLSDMSKDVTEMHNIAAAHPDVVQELSSLHDTWRADTANRS